MRIEIILGAAVILVAACGDDTEQVEPSPDPSTVASSTSGQGGAGGGSGGNGTGGEGGVQNRQGYNSGSRLRARYYDGADGSKVYVGFYDQQLDVNCDVFEAIDGTQRCIPVGPNATPYFADSGCSTTPLAVVFKQSCASFSSGDYVRQFVTSAGACGSSAMRSLLAGPPHTGPVYLLNGNSCIEAPNANTNNWVHQASVVAPSDFVEMSEGID